MKQETYRSSARRENKLHKSKIDFRPRNKNSYLPFEKFAEDANHFIKEVAIELQTEDLHLALRVTKAVLHALRDRLQADSAVEFGQGLPMMIKAIYFDQYDLSDTPVIIRSQQGFIDFIREKDSQMSDIDFLDPQDVIIGLQAVFVVLENTMDYFQVRQVKQQLPKEIQHLIDVYEPYER